MYSLKLSSFYPNMPKKVTVTLVTAEIATQYLYQRDVLPKVKITKSINSGVAKRGGGMQCSAYPPSQLEIFSKYNRTLNSTRFVTIYGFVQSNIQHVSPASRGFARAPHRGSAPGPRDPAGGLLGPRHPLLSPRSKFLATPLSINICYNRLYD